MKILITGANGFLGHYLVSQLLERKHNVIATGKGECRLAHAENELFTYEEMDFTDPFSCHDVFAKHKPEIVVHAGAMTRPDDCEKEQWAAFITNVEGTVSLLLNAEEYKSFFVFVSTDFVFSGTDGPYRETDLPNPVNFYGKTKKEAEEAVHEYEYDWAIVRTVLVYGKPNAGRDNLLTIVKQKIENGEVYRVFDDQVRTPTYVEDLASGIVSIIEKRATGIYHLSGEEKLTPYEMAFKTVLLLGLDQSLLHKITAADMTQPAKRPPETPFIIEKAKAELEFDPISFDEGLRRTFSSS